jgi:hypothetical protein
MAPIHPSCSRGADVWPRERVVATSPGVLVVADSGPVGSVDAWVGLVGVLVGALIGYWLSQRAKDRDDKQQARGFLRVLRLDVERGTELFAEYRRLGSGSPAWRLPTSTWATTITFLAGIRALTQYELMTLARFFEVANELNYCLDDIARSDTGAAFVTGVSGGVALISREQKERRALVKVQHALDPEEPHSEPLTVRAVVAVEAAIARLR